MRDNFLEKSRFFLLCRVPLISALILMFIFFMPLNSVQFNYFRPSIGLICVYYWVLKRDNLFSYASAFVVGFLTDVYSSSPLGVNVLLMLSVVALTKWLAHYFQGSSFGANWFIFGLVGLGAIIFKWLLLMLYFGCYLPLEEAFFGYLSTVMFYPLIVIINIKIQDTFLPQELINE